MSDIKYLGYFKLLVVVEMFVFSYILSLLQSEDRHHLRPSMYEPGGVQVLHRLTLNRI